MPDSGSQSKDRLEVDPKTEAVFKRKNYKLLNKLGAGAFGTVYKAERPSTGELVAVKVMDLNKMSANYRAKFLPRELSTMIEVKHDNIISVYDIIRANQKLYIFMEFAGGGDISGYVRKHQNVKTPLICIWFLQITNGLIHLHEDLFTSHRDIKLDNMLLDNKNIAKLSDFGFARLSYDQAQGKVILSSTYCGTLPYQCPQIISRTPYNPFKADVWAMGVSLYILFHNRFPYHHKDKKAMMGEMKNFPSYMNSRFESNCPKPGRELILSMLNPSETNRTSMKEVQKNDWLVRTANSNSTTTH